MFAFLTDFMFCFQMSIKKRHGGAGEFSFSFIYQNVLMMFIFLVSLSDWVNAFDV